MTKPRRSAPGGTEPLPFAVEALPAGPMQRAVVDVLRLARADDVIDDLDAALVQLCVEAARAIDHAAGDPYAFSQPAAQLRDTLVLLGLDPKSRGATGSDPFSDFLDGLANDGTAGAPRDPAKP